MMFEAESFRLGVSGEVTQELARGTNVANGPAALVHSSFVQTEPTWKASDRGIVAGISQVTK